MSGAAGYAIEYTGEGIRQLSMEGRMTVCNMSIEAGARAGMVAPDETTFSYMRNRPNVPQGDDYEVALEDWRKLSTDPGAKFDKLIELDSDELEPFVTWGTNPGMVIPVTGKIPDPSNFNDPGEVESVERALTYMDLKPNTPI